MVDEELVHHAVDLVGGDARADGLAAGLQRLRADLRRRSASASMTSGGCTQGSVLRVGAGFPTYSGRVMCGGTGRSGVCCPGRNGARTGMPPP